MLRLLTALKITINKHILVKIWHHRLKGKSSDQKKLYLFHCKRNTCFHSASLRRHFKALSILSAINQKQPPVFRSTTVISPNRIKNPIMVGHFLRPIYNIGVAVYVDGFKIAISFRIKVSSTSVRLLSARFSTVSLTGSSQGHLPQFRILSHPILFATVELFEK